jgi:hypothetical protein
MACLKCGSAWVTHGKGLDMASCPECCEQQRCKARKQGRLPPVPATCERTCGDCGCVYTVSYPQGSSSEVCRRCQGHRQRVRGESESVKRRRLCRLVLAFLADARAVMKSQLSASTIANARTNNPPRTCVVCARPFVGDSRRESIACSAECSRLVAFKKSCSCCGALVTVRLAGRDSKKRRKQALCKACVKKLLRKIGRRKKKSEHRQRCRKHGVPYDPAVKPHLVFERDGHRCHVCKRKTLKEFAWVDGKPHPRAPTIDHHPYPLSVGVCGHEWHNVRCCCWECNTKKGAKWDGQLPIKQIIETATGDPL